jgi:hypothetical protein
LPHLFCNFMFLLHTEEYNSVDTPRGISHCMTNGIHSHSSSCIIKVQLKSDLWNHTTTYHTTNFNLCWDQVSQSLHNFLILTNTEKLNKRYAYFSVTVDMYFIINLGSPSVHVDNMANAFLSVVSQCWYQKFCLFF